MKSDITHCIASDLVKSFSEIGTRIPFERAGESAKLEALHLSGAGTTGRNVF